MVATAPAEHQTTISADPLLSKVCKYYLNCLSLDYTNKISVFKDSDGARCFWIQNYTPEQAKSKILAEAQHRPAGMSLGDFVYRRCRVYYETMVDDVPIEFDCRGHDENVIPFMDALLVLE